MGDPDARAQHRRWLIGITITVMFGLFGAVMAVLAYRNSNSSAPAQAPAARPRAPAAEPAAPAAEPAAPDKRHPGKGHGK